MGKFLGYLMLLSEIFKMAKEFYIGFTSSFFPVVVSKVKMKYSGILMVIALIFSSLILVPDISEGGGAPPPNDSIDGLQYIDGDWYVDDYQNYSNEIIILTGNLTINATGVLEFVNVTLKLNATAFCGQYGVYVQNGGWFFVNDTDGDNTTTYDTSVITNSESKMHGFRFQVNDNAGFEIRNSMIENCGLIMGQVDAEKTGVEIYTDNARIINTEIKDGANGIYVDSANIQIENSTIHDNKYNGIYFINDTTTSQYFNLSICNNSIYDNSDSGILLIGETIDVDLSNNSILSNSDGGVLLIGDKNINATISDNNIMSNTGEGGIGMWGTPSQCIIRVEINNNNISDNRGGQPIRMGTEFDKVPVKEIYANITNNTIWTQSGTGDGIAFIYATDLLQLNISFNEFYTPNTKNGLHIGKLSKEYNTNPATEVVDLDLYNNNITNIAAGAVRICSIKEMISNVSNNHIYNSQGLMTCGAVTIGWFKAGTDDTTPENATVVMKNNLIEGVLDTGGIGLKAIYNLNATLENNTIKNVNGWSIGLGWLANEASQAPELWAYPTRNVRAKIVNNTVSGGVGPGIWLYSSSGSNVSDNNVSSKLGSFSSNYWPGDGIRIQSTTGNTVVFNNTASDCTGGGLRLYDAREIINYNNTLTNCEYGIALQSGSNHNILFNNTITKSNDKYGFYIHTNSLNNSIPKNNTVNGEWLRYFYNLFGTVISHEKVENYDVQEPRMANLGQIIIANSTYVDIINNTATNGSNGLSLINVNNSTVINNIARDNTVSGGHGIYLQINTDNNIIQDNYLQGNRYGIGLTSSSMGNRLWLNTITKAVTQTGLYLDPAGTTWENEIPTNNTVEGEPVYYYFQVPQLLLADLNISVPRLTNVGQFIMVDCSNVSLNNLTVINGARGASFYGGDNISFSGGRSTENTYNFYSAGTSNLTIMDTFARSGYVNFYLNTVKDVKIDNCTLMNGTNSVYLISSSPQITNSTIGEATTNALNLTGASYPVLLNTSFNKTNVDISLNSNLTVKWYLHVRVMCKGLPIENARVMVTNSTGSLVYNITTGSDGRTRNLILTEYVNISNNITYFTPYSLNITKDGFGKYNDALTMEACTEVQAILADETAPQITGGPIVGPGVLGTSTETIWLNVTIDDQGYGYSNITNAEWYLSSGYPTITTGAGNPMTPLDGAYDEVNETISASIDISQWTKGNYTLWVHGTDEANNWCDWKQVNITIFDDEGPLVTIGPTVDPQVIGTSMTTIWLTATIDDAGFGDSNLIDVQWGVLSDVASEDINASWSTVTVLDGAFDERIETVTISIDITLWERSNYLISVRGRDVFDNWGPWKNVTIEIVDDEAPTAPADLTVRNLARDGKLELTWSPNSEVDIAGYNIYRTIISGSSYQQVATVGPDNTTWEDEGLENGVTYYYVITAFDDASTPNESPYSDEAGAIPTTPSLLSKIWWALIVIPLMVVVIVLFFFKGKIFNPLLTKEQVLEEPKAE